MAALAIVIFHFLEWVYADYSHNFIAHGFLAVDFFFCLSGFVIGYAYDDRIRQLGLAAFFRVRLIRLHPLVILGSVLGLLGSLFDPFAAQPGLSGRANLWLTFVCSLCLIPLPIMKERAFNLFSFNAPAWSLFWEYVANIIYALVVTIMHYLLTVTAHCTDEIILEPPIKEDGIRIKMRIPSSYRTTIDSL